MNIYSREGVAGEENEIEWRYCSDEMLDTQQRLSYRLQ